MGGWGMWERTSARPCRVLREERCAGRRGWEVGLGVVGRQAGREGELHAPATPPAPAAKAGVPAPRYPGPAQLCPAVHALCVAQGNKCTWGSSSGRRPALRLSCCCACWASAPPPPAAPPPSPAAAAAAPLVEDAREAREEDEAAEDGGWEEPPAAGSSPEGGVSGPSEAAAAAAISWASLTWTCSCTWPGGRAGEEVGVEWDPRPTGAVGTHSERGGSKTQIGCSDAGTHHGLPLGRRAQ